MSLRIGLRAPLLVLGGATMALFVNVKLALFLIIPIPLLFTAHLDDEKKRKIIQYCSGEIR